MMIRKTVICLGCFLLPVFISQRLSAQEDSTRLVRDSVRVAIPETPEMSRPVYSSSDVSPETVLSSSSLHSEGADSLPRFSLKETFRIPYYTNPSPLFRGDYRTNGIIMQFHGGALSGAGGQTTLPGIGRFNEASLLYRQVIDRNLSFQLGMDALKLNMSHISGQAFTASGALMYQAADRLAFKVFGSYAIGNTYGMTTHRYGGSVLFNVSERFSMEVGVQRYYNAMRGRWETVPMVIPTYNFDKFKLGLDVGGIIYEILRSKIYSGRSGGGGPTIGPPRFDIPMK
ncbi:hypothetical protein [Prevotella heparinolytica]